MIDRGATWRSRSREESAALGKLEVALVPVEAVAVPATTSSKRASSVDTSASTAPSAAGLSR